MASRIKITFLGTADQIPSADRNHSAILISYDGENILVDCGEGTQRQFRKANLNPCKITKILITHIHGDHVFGLPGLLSTLNFSGYGRELRIYGPKGIKRFLGEFLNLDYIGRNFKIIIDEVHGKFYETKDFYIEAERMEHGIPCNAYNFVIRDKIRLDKGKLKKMKIPEGPHLKQLKEGKDAVIGGKKIKAKDLVYEEKGKKISFVLDTKKNERIVPFVKGADFLISEAEFSEELKDQAEEHLHMTSVDAAENAKKAKAGKLILTHISQRYENNLGKILKEARKVFKNTFIVKDFDSIEF